MPPESDGVTVRIAGRSTPGSRPSTNIPMAIMAPEFPALTTASPSPAFKLIEGDPHGRILLLQRTGGGVVHVDGGRRRARRARQTG